MMKRFANWLWHHLMKIPAMREPDFIVGPESSPYLRRWWVIPRNRFFNIYLHHFLSSDEDRALHDHPWCNVSLILNGSYVEVTPPRYGIWNRRTLKRAGSLNFRRASSSHRIELIESRPVWTLFITGPVVREWGFHCPQGWRHWRDFCDPDNPGLRGKGCED